MFFRWHNFLCHKHAPLPNVACFEFLLGYDEGMLNVLVAKHVLRVNLIHREVD